MLYNPPWDFSFARALVELLACSVSPLSGVTGTTEELLSLFAEGLLSAERDVLDSEACGTRCCCKLAPFPLPLSPEPVLPVSLLNLDGRPLLLSWGVSVEVLPCPRLTWLPILCSSLAVVLFSLLRLADLWPSLCTRVSLLDFSVDKALAPLSWDCLTVFTGVKDSSIPLFLLLLFLVESTPHWRWPGR